MTQFRDHVSEGLWFQILNMHADLPVSLPWKSKTHEVVKSVSKLPPAYTWGRDQQCYFLSTWHSLPPQRGISPPMGSVPFVLFSSVWPLACFCFSCCFLYTNLKARHTGWCLLILCLAEVQLGQFRQAERWGCQCQEESEAMPPDERAKVTKREPSYLSSTYTCKCVCFLLKAFLTCIMSTEIERKIYFGNFHEISFWCGLTLINFPIQL